MVEAERLTFAFAEAADRRGADLANYVEAVAALRDGSRVVGMEVRDILSGQSFSITARATVNATGSHAPAMMALFGDPQPVPMLRAMNLVTTVPASDIALAARLAAGRLLTLVPWRGCALIGTSQTPVTGTTSAARVTSAEVAAFVADANSAFPALGLTPARVSLVHRGVVPAAAAGSSDLRTGGSLIEHRGRSAFSVLGLKYTTARGIAEHTVDAVSRRSEGGGQALSHRLDHPAGCRHRGSRGAGHRDGSRAASRRPVPTLRHLTARYAERASDIVRLMKPRLDAMAPLDITCATTGAEVLHVIRQEMAVHLTDIVIRRTALGAAGHPGRAAVAACAAVAGEELGWTRSASSTRCGRWTRSIR